MLIAEIGCNWNGKMGVARTLISLAKNAGFDAVKFAVFDKDHWGKYPQYPTLKQNTLTEETIPEMFDICKEIGIEFFATPCFMKAVDWLDPYVSRYKVRYADRNKSRLIEKIRDTGKMALISGRKTKIENWKSLYCIPKYPTQPDEIDYNKMATFDGYSCHCVDPFSLTRAFAMKLKYYEIHMVLFHGSEFIDSMVSFDFNELRGLTYPG